MEKKTARKMCILYSNTDALFHTSELPKGLFEAVYSSPASLSVAVVRISKSWQQNVAWGDSLLEKNDSISCSSKCPIMKYDDFQGAKPSSSWRNYDSSPAGVKKKVTLFYKARKSKESRWWWMYCMWFWFRRPLIAENLRLGCFNCDNDYSLT